MVSRGRPAPAAQPTASASEQSVTVQWAQSTFEGSPLGTYSAGGYVLTRYAQARARDAAGNRSGTVGPTNVVVKDTAPPPLTADYSSLLGLGPKVSGNSECGATVRATKTSGSNVGAVFSTQITSGSSYSFAVEGPPLLGSVSYSVTAEDLAGNTSTAVTTGG